MPKYRVYLEYTVLPEPEYVEYVVEAEDELEAQEMALDLLEVEVSPESAYCTGIAMEDEDEGV